LVLEIRPAARVEVVPAEAANQETGQCFSWSGHNVGVSLEIHPVILPIGSMYGIYGNIYHEYTPVMLALIYQHHGYYGLIHPLFVDFQ